MSNGYKIINWVSFSISLQSSFKLSIVNLSIFIKLSATKLLSKNRMLWKIRKSAQECKLQARKGAVGGVGGRRGRRGLAVGLPSATHATKCQARLQWTSRELGQRQATNTNGNPKSVYFCSCRCPSSTALCVVSCRYNLNTKSTHCFLFFFSVSLSVFLSHSRDRQTDSAHLV